MPEGGKLTVATRFDQKKDRIEIRVSDTGPGIPEEDVERIFEPFYTTKAEGKGVGLGLSVAYGIIRQHQGEIHFQSEVGQGTNVIIHLPPGPRSLPVDDRKEEEYVFATSSGQVGKQEKTDTERR